MVNEIEFLRKNKFLNHPRILQVELTTLCPLNCPHCYKDLSGTSEIDYSKLISLLERQKYVKSVMINGGEPLLYSNFFPLLEKCRSLEIRVFCFTSGVTIDRKQAKALKEYNNLFLNISLNGSVERINKLSRDGYAYAINAIHILKEERTRFGINWVARHDNIRDFKNVINLAKAEGANNILVINNKRSFLNRIDSPVTHNDILNLAEIISDHNNRQSTVEIIVQQCFVELMSVLYGNKHIPLSHGCPSGRLFCSVNHNMEFMPCSHIYSPEKYDSLDDYWHYSEILKRVRNNTLCGAEPFCVTIGNSKDGGI